MLLFDLVNNAHSECFVSIFQVNYEDLNTTLLFKFQPEFKNKQ